MAQVRWSRAVAVAALFVLAWGCERSGLDRVSAAGRLDRDAYADVDIPAPPEAGASLQWPECDRPADCRWGERCRDRQCETDPDRTPAWDFTLKDRNPASRTWNQPVRLADLAGNVVVLYFGSSS